MWGNALFITKMLATAETRSLFLPTAGNGSRFVPLLRFFAKKEISATRGPVARRPPPPRAPSDTVFLG